MYNYAICYEMDYRFTTVCTYLHASYAIECFYACTFDEFIESYVLKLEGLCLILATFKSLLCSYVLFVPQTFCRVSKRTHELVDKWVRDGYVVF